MTDETINNDDQGSAEEVKTYSQADIDALTNQLTETSQERDRLQGHSQTLLQEAKDAKKRAKEISDQQELDAASKTSNEEFEATLRAQFAEKETASEQSWQAKFDEVNNALLGGAETTAVAKLSGLFNSPEMGEFIVKNMTKASLADGKVEMTFTDTQGKKISNSLDGMMEYLKNDPVIQPHLKGVDSSGLLDGNGRPNANASQKTITREQFDKLSPAEKAKQAQFVR